MTVMSIGPKIAELLVIAIEINNVRASRVARERKMKIRKFLMPTIAVVLINLTFIGGAAAESPICAGLTGAAFGQCTAAVAVGCDGSIDQPNGCARIEKNFTRLSGESAPWVLGTCACYTLEEVTEVIERQTPEYPIYWQLELLDEKQNNTFRLVPTLLGHFLPISVIISSTEGSGSCTAFGYTTAVDAVEASACFATLSTAADNTGISEKPVL